MAAFLFAAVALIVAADARSSIHSDRGAAQTSVSQIKDTLRNLLRSVADTGKDSDALLDTRQKWCTSTVHSFETTNELADSSLVELQGDLSETQAQIEETEGVVQQLNLNIEMVQHTILQTEDMLKEHQAQGGMDASSIGLLGSLVDNKRTSLASLQAEVDIAVPVLSQLQATSAELQQRVSYRSESVAARKAFIDALQDGCQAASARADAQTAARTGESNAIRTAMQGLESLDVATPGSSPQDLQDAQDTAEDGLNSFVHVRDGGNEDGSAVDLPAPSMPAINVSAMDMSVLPASFLQVGDRGEEVTTDDLTDLFADRQGPPMPAAPSAQQTAPLAEAPSQRPRIQMLLAQLKDAASAPADGDAWCLKQQQSGELALKFAQDSVAQVTSENAAHKVAEDELSEDLAAMQASAAAIDDAGTIMKKQTAQEHALVQSSRKDQQLAAKILQQAATILKELDTTAAVGVRADVLISLTSAQQMFVAQIHTDIDLEKEAMAKAKVFVQRAQDLTVTQATEQHNIEFAQDDHSMQRLRGVKDRRLYEGEATEAAAYMQKLAESCKTDISSTAKQQYSTQVLALEDADKALNGKLAARSDSQRPSLRGPAPLAVAPEAMTPMQRAAAEMGLNA